MASASKFLLSGRSASLSTTSVTLSLYNLSPKRTMMTTTTTTTTTTNTRTAKSEGSIADIFTSLTGEEHSTLPERFADLKKQLWKDELKQSWKEVLEALPKAVEEIAKKGSEIIPRVKFEDIQAGRVTPEQIAEIKRIGTVVVQGAVPPEEALAWKQSIKDYAAANADRVKGFPPDNIQVFEIYNSKAQTQARTHPNIIATQKFLLSLWHTSESQEPKADLSTPLSYFDRLRIRQPGDAKFTLGPHIDGGAVERWEDEGLRGVFGRIFEVEDGNVNAHASASTKWRAHDPFDVDRRIGARCDLYNAPNACSIFRAWQGWTSLSSTGPGEGTLKVLPMLSLATAYVILRPFFRPTSGTPSLKPEDWTPDLDTPTFPGSSIGKTQELNERTHPHLELGRTMVSVPRVEPGDQVYWHCDVVHAVEARHGGKGDSSVLYIPAVPLTLHNASYLRDQRANFLAGLPPPDFPGGEGESSFIGRGTPDDILSGVEGRRMLGLEAFEVPEGEEGEERRKRFVEEVNKILGF